MIERIETDRLILRTGTAHDALRVLEYFERNRTFLGPYEPAQPPDFYTKPWLKKMILNDARAREAEEALRFWLFLKEEPETVIGSVRFSAVVRGAFQSCFLGYRLDGDLEGRGYMTEALKASIPYAFQQLRLHRIEANVMPWNIASRRVLVKLGFREEGLAKRYLKINGKWEDHVHFAMTTEDWEEINGTKIIWQG
jgi:ribosomal-protein-alanine N-acetyltransferase